MSAILVVYCLSCMAIALDMVVDYPMCRSWWGNLLFILGAPIVFVAVVLVVAFAACGGMWIRMRGGEH